ncbi:MAG: hypothetical protein JSR64_19445 [Nitrospira sp.]|nr:hypothetical protein [Nitrospira sp.]MBS0193996.1 hypothetical protein [Pseudomonadota bacterium]
MDTRIRSTSSHCLLWTGICVAIFSLLAAHAEGLRIVDPKNVVIFKDGCKFVPPYDFLTRHSTEPTWNGACVNGYIDGYGTVEAGGAVPIKFEGTFSQGRLIEGKQFVAGDDGYEVANVFSAGQYHLAAEFQQADERSKQEYEQQQQVNQANMVNAAAGVAATMASPKPSRPTGTAARTMSMQRPSGPSNVYRVAPTAQQRTSPAAQSTTAGPHIDNSYDRSSCVSIETDQLRGQVFVNHCGETIEVTWCSTQQGACQIAQGVVGAYYLGSTTTVASVPQDVSNVNTGYRAAYFACANPDGLTSPYLISIFPQRGQCWRDK